MNDTYRAALKHLPDIVGELRSYIEPGKTPSDRPTRFRGSTPPIAIGPTHDADNTYAALTEHCEAIAEALDTRPPDTGIRRVNDRPQGFPADTPPETAFVKTRTLCRFIAHQLHMVKDDFMIREIEADIVRSYRTLTAKYPPEALPERLQARCGNCRRLTVFKHPPRSFGTDETFICKTCGKWHSEIEIMERRASRERELKAKKKRTA
ncbi:hypothetical protein [Brevibacterium otitidis]|uniref:GATA-type domain-containing protein n=1 Tax=Brevibacterium otitidis TaxID=53364 RepID=A0ABV5X1U4_9MICO|nr:hypothetical protein GCM10023233_04770 [Brevibacterium otitidis]